MNREMYSSAMDDGKEYGNVCEDETRKSWMVGSFRKLIKPQHEQDFAILPGSSPMKSQCTTLMDSFSSPTPPKIPLRRLSLSAKKKILSSSSEKGHLVTFNENQEGRDENVEEVYENVEVLLEALRTERHMEKLQAEQEIKALKEKIVELEHSKDLEQKPEVVSNNTNSNVNLDLVESLLETLALLEEECDEWQNTKRKSLDTITNNENHPTPETYRQTTTPFKTPRQKMLANSVRRLRAMESQLKEDCQRKSLVSTFDHEADNNTGLSTPSDEKLRMKELQQEMENKTKCHNKEIEELKKDAFRRQQEYTVLSSKLQAAKADKKKQDANIHNEIQKNQSLRIQVEQLEGDLIEKTAKIDGFLEKLESVEQDKENLRDEYDRKLDGMAQDVHIAERTCMEMNVQLSQQLQKHRGSENSLKDQIKMLHEQVEELQFKLTDTERERDDLKMQLAIEKHSNLSTRVKLDSTTFQLTKQKAVTNTLTTSLDKTRFESVSNLHQAAKLRRKLEYVQREKEAALQDRNETLRRQRMEFTMLKDAFGECIMGA